MKIVRLELRNYRRHRDTRLELPDGVTALLGPNGAGKSSLLEGIGFALFGAAAARTGKDLLRSEGAPPGDAVHATLEMEVAGQAWRITRELRGKALAPHATLEIDGTAIVAGGAGSADAVTTQVERRLGIPQEAFFTTVVARQKELSRLADQAPAERRRLLLEMLGVDAVDRAVAKAREERRAAEERLAALRSVLPDPAALESALATAAQRHQAAMAASAAALDHWQRAQNALQAAAADAASAERLAAERAAVERAAADAARATAQLRTTLASLDARERDSAAAQAQADALGDTAAALAAARRRIDEAHRLRLAAERAAQAQRALQAQAEAVAALRSRPPPPPGAAPDLAAAAAGVAAAEGRLRAAQDGAAAVRARHQHMATHRAELERLGPEAPCPTCERTLAGHIGPLRERVAAGLHAIEAAMADANARLDDAQAARMDAACRQEEAMRMDRAHQRLLAERAAWEVRLRDEEARLAGLRKDPPEATPTAPDPAPLEAALGDAGRRHDEATRLRALAETGPALAAERAALAQALAAAEASERAAASRLAALPEPPALAPAQGRHRAAQEAERLAERATHAAAAEERSAQEALATLRQRAGEAAQLRSRAAGEAAALAAWTQLVGARGGGLLERFRDHLASRIGPAVSREASHLLARFTGGRYTDILLDERFGLYVADGGVAYTIDRLSGGEADLVHLAVRLAVSRLLASRGGAEIRFLALDEVFGSLDRERRGLVLAALRALGGIYSQVLLVTHLDELEDALDQSLRVGDDGGRAVVTAHKG